MTRLARLAAVLPIAAAAVVFATGTAGASVGGAAAQPCDGNPSYGNTHITVSCTTSAWGNQFRAMILCPSGDWHFGPWVPQGPGHVSVATCAYAMQTWDWDLRQI